MSEFKLYEKKRKEAESIADEEIVVLISNGQKQYFEISHDRYREKVYTKCLTMTNRKSIADWESLLEIPEESNEEEVFQIMDLQKDRLTLLL
jgi:hypothetical protein